MAIGEGKSETGTARSAGAPRRRGARRGWSAPGAPAAVTLLAVALAACGGAASDRHPSPPPPVGHGAKVPITAASEEARQLYLEGRELSENLRAAEARRYFENAVARDPAFALAHLGLAITASSAQEFFSRLERAVALADQVSDGERWMILGLEAGVKGQPAAQERLYRQLAGAFPEDERVQTLLGNFHRDRQEVEPAILRYRQAIEIAPDFPPPYNQLGYAYRSQRRWGDAEGAFKKYIALVPGEPNPYDSYAELLMKTGRFEESIASYRKALSINDGFVQSYRGLGLDQIFLGFPAKAQAIYRQFYDRARDDGERRQALAWMAVGYLFAGDHRLAAETLRRRAAFAEAAGDLAALADDHRFLGDVLLDDGRPPEALAEYDRGLATLGGAAVSDEIKEGGRRDYLYRRAQVALATGELGVAAAKLAAYRAAVERTEIPFERRQAHELAGRLALAKGDPAGALGELAQANQQDPKVLYFQALAARAAGDAGGARTFAREAAEFNGLEISYAFVRPRAKALLAELE